MKTPSFATFKYDHGDTVAMEPKQKRALLIGVVVALLCFLIATPVAIVGLVIVFICMIKFWPKKNICISPRYLVCGKSVLYYRNVDKMILQAEQGNLTLFWGENKSLRIEREKFPTSARKAPKVAANKKAKFTKISTKIIEKVRAASPDVKLVGIGR